MTTTVLFAVLVLAIPFTAALVVYGWRARGQPGAQALMWAAICDGSVLGAELVSMLSPDATQAQLWFQLRFLVTGMIPTFWLIFAIEYSGHARWLTPRLRLLFFVVPLLSQIAHFTNPLHGQWVSHDVTMVFVDGFWLSDVSTRVPGLLYWVHIIYSLLIGFAGAGVIAAVGMRGGRDRWGKTLLLTGASLIGLLLAIAPSTQLNQSSPFNTYALGIALSIFLIAAAAWRYRFLRRPFPATSMPTDEIAALNLGGQILILLWMTTAIVAGGVFAYQNDARRLRAEAENQLLVIAQLKAEQIINWRAERLYDGERLDQNLAFGRLVARLLASPADRAARTELESWLRQIEEHPEYAAVYLLDTQGRPILAVPETAPPPDDDLVGAAKAVTPTSVTTMLDFHRHPEDEHTWLAVLVPILSTGPDRQPLGLVALRIDPTRYLYPYVQEWPVPSATAETLLVRREGNDVLYLNPLRFAPDAALTLRIPLTNTAVPAVQAVLGHTGIVEGLDYRGAPAVAAVMGLAGTPWFLIARMDPGEIYASLAVRRLGYVLLVVALLAAVSAGAELIRRRQAVRYYQRQAAAEAALRSSEERFRTLVEEISTAIYIQTNLRLVYVNRAAQRLFGAERPEQLIGQPILDRFHPDFRARVRDRIHLVNDLRHGVPPAEMTILRLDGSEVIVEVAASPFVWDGEPGAIAYAHDVTKRRQAEDALRASESALQRAQALAHVGSWSWDVGHNRVTWSAEMYRIFGVDPATFDGDLNAIVAQAIHPEDRAAVEASNRSVMEQTLPIPLEYRVIHADGSVRTVWAEGGELVVDAAGNPQQLSGIVQDITARKQAELALRESEVRYRTLLELAPIGIVVLVDEIVVFANPAAARLLGGKEPADLLGRHIGTFLMSGGLDVVHERWRRVTAGEANVYPTETTYRRLDGTPVDVEVDGTRILYEGRPAWQALLTDISQRKYAEAQLRLQATALQAAANAIVVTDRTGRIEWFNPAFTELTGYSLAESRGESLHDLQYAGVTDPQTYRRMWETIEAGEIWHGEIVNRRHDGSLYTEEQTVTPVTDTEGRVTHFVAMKQDISARKQHEVELATVSTVSAALRTATTRAEMVPLILDQLLNLLQVEGTTLVAVTPDRDEVVVELGAGVWHDRTGERIPIRAGITAKILATGRAYLNNDIDSDPHRYRAGSFAPCRSIIGAPLVVKGEVTGLVWMGANRAFTDHDLRLLTSIADIAASALHRALLHDQMQAQAQQLAQIMETVPQGILLIDTHGEVALANPVAERLLPTLTGAAVGTPVTQLGDRALAELLVPPQQGLRPEVKVGAQVFEITARPIPGDPAPDQWVLLIDDVSQTRQVQNQLQQQERLAAVGQLAAGIAHDFNNIMAVIVLYAEMAARSAGLSDRDRDRMRTVIDQARRASDLIRQILDFSRQSFLERQILDLLPLAKEQVKLLERTLPESIATRLVFEEGDYTVNADPTRLQQLIMNLAINARDAMPEGGELVITLTHLLVAEDAASVLTLKPGPWVVLTVADTGSGIPPEVLPHIFDPFFTTKAPGKGTGLGLAQVHGIVAQHEGRIDVSSEPDKGAIFTVYLPAVEIARPNPVGATPGLMLLGNGEELLVVEDNAALRSALVEMVAAMGYTVSEAANGQEALSVLQKHDRPIAAVLSDVVMPVMGGVPFLHALRAQGWTLPVIFMTGHPLEHDLDSLQGLGVDTWLMKPVHPGQLAQALKRALMPL